MGWGEMEKPRGPNTLGLKEKHGSRWGRACGSHRFSRSQPLGEERNLRVPSTSAMCAFRQVAELSGWLSFPGDQRRCWGLRVTTVRKR